MAHPRHALPSEPVRCERWLNGSDGSPQPQSFDISGFATSQTQIRLCGSGSIPEEISTYFFVDDVQIDYTTDNEAPVLVNNTGSSVGKGSTDAITNTELRYDDNAQPAGSVTYAVTGGLANGQLELTTDPGTAITSFTQDDIDSGRLVYVHDGTATTTDSFTFDVDDGQGNVLAAQSFSFTVAPTSIVFTVVNANDTGVGSLRDAITSANAAGE